MREHTIRKFIPRLISFAIVLVLFFFAQKANASVYGYILKIWGYESSVEIPNGSSVNYSSVRAGNVSYRLKVIDPNDPEREFEVSSWDVNLAEDFGSDFSISKSINKNVMDVALSVSSPINWDEKGTTLSGQATVDAEVTNSVSFRILVKNPIAPSPTPTPSVEPTLSVIPTITASVGPTITAPPEIKKPIINPEIIEKAGPPVSTAAAAAAAISVLIPSFLTGASGQLVANAIGWLQRPLSFIFWPRRKVKWGIVYDAVTKKPISGVIVRIYSEPESKIKDQQITDSNGTFGFLVKPGEYSITASKTNYDFPTQIVTSATDGDYTGIYRGGVLKIGQHQGEAAPVKINIPLDPTEDSTVDHRTAAVIQKIKGFFSILRFPILISGLMFSAYLAYRSRNERYYIFLILYVILFVAEFVALRKKRTYGLVVDDLLKPIDLAQIRILSDSSKIIATTFSTSSGEFVVRVNPGSYFINASKVGYQKVMIGPIALEKATDLGAVKIKLNKVSRKKS